MLTKKERQALKEFKIEMGLWGKLMRLRYFVNQMEERVAHIKTMQEFARVSISRDDRVFIMSCIEQAREQLNKLDKAFESVHKTIKHPETEITPEMIEQARNYPISELIEVKHGMALCINHTEKTPSMNCKNNFAYCHACGWHGDTISAYMMLNNVSFRDAVRKLQ